MIKISLLRLGSPDFPGSSVLLTLNPPVLSYRRTRDTPGVPGSSLPRKNPFPPQDETIAAHRPGKEASQASVKTNDFKSLDFAFRRHDGVFPVEDSLPNGKRKGNPDRLIGGRTAGWTFHLRADAPGGEVFPAAQFGYS